MSTSIKTIVVPHPDNPDVSTFELEATDHGSGYTHGMDISLLARAFNSGFSTSVMAIYANETSHMHAVFGLEQTLDPLIIHVTSGIFRAIVLTGNGAVATIEEGKTRGGLRPTRGLLVPAHASWAIQSLVRNRSSFTVYRHRQYGSPVPIKRDAKPFADWYEGIGTSDRPIFANNR